MVVLWLVVAILWIYALVEAITTDDVLIRNLPKVAWVFVIIFLPLVGTVMWFLFGRPETASGRAPRPRMQRRPPARPITGPEDSPDFMRSIDDEHRRDDDNGTT